MSKRFSQNPQIPSPLSLEKKPHEDPIAPADFSQLFESQARALEHLCEILNRKESQEKEIRHLRFGYQNVKKALISLWNKNKALEARNTAPTQEELSSLHEKIANLESRQGILEQVILKQSRMIKQLYLHRKEMAQHQTADEN